MEQRLANGKLAGYLCLDVGDFGTDDGISRVFEDAFAFLDAAIDSGGVVFVHCANGSNRSPTVVIGYLKHRFPSWTMKRVLEHVLRVRPHIMPLKDNLAQLAQWSGETFDTEMFQPLKNAAKKQWKRVNLVGGCDNGKKQGEKKVKAAEKATKARPKAKATEVDAKVDEKAGGDLESAASSSYLSSLRGAWVDFTGASSGDSASSSPLEDLLGWWRGKSGELVGEDGAGSSSDGGEDEGEGDDEPWGYGDGRDSYRSPRRPSGEAGSDESRKAVRLRRAVGGMGGWFRNIAKQAEEDGDEE